jgi:hypothetical protein
VYKDVPAANNLSPFPTLQLSHAPSWEPFVNSDKVLDSLVKEETQLVLT